MSPQDGSVCGHHRVQFVVGEETVGREPMHPAGEPYLQPLAAHGGRLSGRRAPQEGHFASIRIDLDDLLAGFL